MKLFHTHDRCRGLTLWRWGRLNVELWFCPAGYEIVPHSHPLEDIELVPLFGWCTFIREDALRLVGQRIECSPRRWFRKHSVPAGWVHWFKVGRKVPLVFINVARWKPGVPITSASEDFLVAAP